MSTFYSKLIKSVFVSSLACILFQSCRTAEVQPNSFEEVMLPEVKDGRLVFKSREHFGQVLTTLETYKRPDFNKGISDLKFNSLERSGVLKDSLLSFPVMYKNLLNANYEYEINDTIFHYDLKAHSKYIIPKKDVLTLERLKNGQIPEGILKTSFGYTNISSSKNSGGRVYIQPYPVNVVPGPASLTGSNIVAKYSPEYTTYRYSSSGNRMRYVCYLSTYFEGFDVYSVYTTKYVTRVYLNFSTEVYIGNSIVWELARWNANIASSSTVLVYLPQGRWGSGSNTNNENFSINNLNNSNPPSNILLQEFSYLTFGSNIWHYHSVEVTGNVSITSLYPNEPTWTMNGLIY